MDQFLRSSFIPSIARGYVDSISVGDFSGDGKADFLIGRIDIENPTAPVTNLQAFIGDGRGGFTDASSTLLHGDITTNYVVRTVIGDFNGDGIDDAFLVESGTDVEPYAGAQNKLFLSDAATGKLVNATSALPQKILFSHGASAGDTTGTGKLDILVNALMLRGNDLWLNNGKGQFTAAGTSIMPRLTLPAPWDPAQTTAQTFTVSEFIDVNNDGFVDMVLGGWHTSGGTTTSKVLLNDGKGSFAGSLPIDLPDSRVQKQTVVSIDSIDLNGDDLPDLVLSITNSDEGSAYYKKAYLQLLVNDGNGRFHDETQLRLPQSTVVSESGGWYKYVNVVDFNHDGYQDIVAFSFGNTPVSIWLADAAGRFNDRIDLPGGQRVGNVADVDNSGMYDLITRSADYTGIDVWTNNLVNQHIYKAGFDGGKLVGSADNDTFIAMHRDEGVVVDGGKLLGSADNDTFNAMHRGKNIFVGNGGRDTLKLAGTGASYTIAKSADGFIVKGQTVDVTARGIDRIVFDDASGIAFDKSAAQVFRLYTAAFDRTADKEGTGFWLAAMDNGVSLVDIASSFIGSPEFAGMYGANSSNERFVSLLYKHVLHRELDQAGSDFWVNGLDNGVSRANILAGFSESIENVAQVEMIIATGVQYQV